MVKWSFKNITQVSEANKWQIFFDTNEIPNHFTFAAQGAIYL